MLLGFTLTVNGQCPIIDAGPAASLCETGNYITSTATGVNYESVLWTSSGTGTFLNANQLSNATYIPSVGDINAGSVILILTAIPQDTCTSGLTYSSQLILTIDHLPTVNAGSDFSICEIESPTLNGNASNYATVLWITDGDGNFSDASILNPIYSLGPNDITSGLVNLTLTNTGANPCGGSYTDQLSITIEPAPTVDAGVDLTSCGQTEVQLNANATNYDHASIVWSGGSGSFNSTSTLNPIYSPSADELNEGSVILTIAVNSQNPCFSTISSNIVITLLQAEISAGGDLNACIDENVVIYNSSARDVTIVWSSINGTGTFNDETLVNPTYTPSAIDYFNAPITLVMTATPIGSCSNTITDQMQILSFSNGPTVFAGSDTTICQTGSYETIFANTNGQESSVLWSTGGNGSFGSQNQLITSYTPGSLDIQRGYANIILRAYPISPCANQVTHSFRINIQRLPIVSAGDDESVCEGSSLQLSTASVSFSNSLEWTTSGDGSFSDITEQNPIYTPGSIDQTNGSFRLTLTSTSNSPCAETISDFKDVSIVYFPTANAGPDIFDRCAGDSYTVIESSATNYSTINWSTSGSGILTNANSLNPTYTISDNDALLGTITLTMEVIANSPCVTSVLDTFLIHIIPSVIVFAGDDFSICNGETFTINDATATNHNDVSWSTSGTGTFSDQNTLTPTYTPGFEDIETGTVNLILTGKGDPLCPEKSDNIIITINKDPIINAGTTTDICSVPSMILGATAQHYSSLSWASSGTGILNFGNTLTPTYTPSVVDVETGVVTLTLTAFPISPCAAETTSSILVNVHQAPLIGAGNNDTICEGETYSLITASSAYVTNLLWTSSGTGVFADPNIANTIYTPSESDAALGNITLTLTGGNLSCTDESDYMVLTIQGKPNVFAGRDSTLCENGTYVVADAVIKNYSSILWTHNGSGTISGETTISPVYTAGVEDLSAGRIILNVAVTAASPCVGITNDVLILDVKHLPTSYAGVDTTICITENYTVVGATATDYESVNWSSSGTGAFLHSGTISPTYIPSQEDLDRGNVVLRIHASNSPCNNVTDQMTISFALLPEVNAGFDATVNFGTPFEISTSSVSNNSGLLWTTSGTGAFSNPSILNPTYTASAQDFAIGRIVLTLTSFGISPCNELSDDMLLTITDNPDVVFTWENACESTLMQFVIDRDSTDVNSIVTWDWDFGDGNTSTLMEPTHIFATSGTYSVSLTIVDINNYTTKLTNEVIITQLPIVNFDYTKPSCINLATEFIDYSNTVAGYITEWHYSFGDGNEQTITFPEDPNITHSYLTPGTYTVLLNVTNSLGCSNSVAKDIIVDPIPLANFHMEAYCLSGSANFEDLSQENSAGTIINWQWNFGDPDSGVDNTSVLQHPSHLFINTGTYSVSLQITNANGCTNSIVLSFDVSILPEVDFYNIGSTCVNNEQQFFINTEVVNLANVQSIKWDFGDGSPFSTEPNPKHIYVAPGTYTAILSIDNMGCESSISYPIIVHPGPTSLIEFSLACENNLTDFKDQSTEANYRLSSWSWDFGDPGRIDDISILQNPSYYYTESGTYIVTLSVTDENGCSETSQTSIEVFPSPISAFTIESNYEETQGRILLINESIDALDYVWDFGDGTSSNEENPIHNFIEDGTYTIELSSWNNYNCPNTTSSQFQFIFKGLFIPNAFSPNSPNEKVSKFKAIGINLSSFKIEVYDSWGAIIWESEILDENGSPAEEWDGTYKGSPLPQGVYAWKASGVFLDGSIWEGKDLGNNSGGSGQTSGTITIIR